MEYVIGVGLAVAVCAFAMLTGFDRDRVFYPTVVAVNATYYILFAVMGSSTPALVLGSVVAGGFFVEAVVYSTAGKTRVKAEPLPKVLSTATAPDIFSQMCFTMDSPSPVPPVSRDRALSTQ